MCAERFSNNVLMDDGRRVMCMRWGVLGEGDVVEGG